MDFDASVLMRQAGPASAVDSSGPLSKRQILFTNWLLLGLDIPTLERKYSIPFNRDMFSLPNKAGAEAILNFLFTRLNPVMCKEEFRDCWPVRDKKSEALFYRTCNKWLRNIQKDEPDSHLPRINASLFMSPGGEKFCQLLFSFTNYVIQQVIKRECDVKQRDQLSWPQLSPHNKHLSEVMYRMVQCGIVQRRQKFLDQMETSITVSEQWRETVSEYVREYRRLSKSIRDLEHNLRDESQRAYEKGIARGSPHPSRRSFSSEQDRSSHMIKRAQRVQKVRDKWKKLDAFCNVETRERQVIESILDRTLQKYNIDAADISIKVPDLLLRECENEILKRHVDNTYEGGKLNILSLLQLWNLSLHLYIEKFHQVGVTNLEADSSHLTAAVQTHHAQIANANAFEKMLCEDFLPLLKQSVSRLRTKLEADTSHMMGTPQSGRTRPLGLGLISSTPPLSFTPRDDDPTLRQSMHITPQQETVMTPEAADNIANTVAKSARKVAKTLFQGSPVYAPMFAMQGKQPLSNRFETSKIPQPYQLKTDRQMTTPDSRTPSRSRQNPHSQVDRPLNTPDHQGRTLNSSLHADRLSDVLSLTQSSNSTLTESQLAGGSPRPRVVDHGSPRDTDTGRSLPLTTTFSKGSPRSAAVESVIRESIGSGSPSSTPRKGPPHGRSVDDFVDEVVSHMLDHEDTENQPPMDYLQRLQDQQLSRSLPRSPFLPYQYQSLMDEEDFNTSNSSVQQNKTQEETSFNGQNLSLSQIQDDKRGDGEHSSLPSWKGRGSQTIPRSGSVQYNSDQKPFLEDGEVFRHPEIPIDFVRNGHEFHSPQSKHQRQEHRRSLGSEVFRHPEIPEDLSPEIDPSHFQTSQKVIHSPPESSLPKLNDPSHQSRSELTDPRKTHGLSDCVDVVEDDRSTSFRPPTDARQPAEGEAACSQDRSVFSVGKGSLSTQLSPPSQQQDTGMDSTALSPDKKLGSHLETEIRRMWRESLDGETHPGSPTGEAIHGSVGRGNSDYPNVGSSKYSASNKTQTGWFQLEANGFMGMGADDDFTTLDDVTADILLSPENLDEDETRMSSEHRPFGSSLCPEDELFSTKTPQIPRLGSKYTSYSASPEFSTVKANISSSVDDFLANTSNMTVPRFSVEAHSPLVSQSLPLFSRAAAGLSTTKDEKMNTSHLRSVFDEALSDAGLDEETPPDLPLDDSFVPLLDGLHLEGRSPHKPSEPKETVSSSDPSHDEIMARFHQLKKTVKQVLHDNSESTSKLEELQNPDLLQSTSSSDERLMLALEKKYVTGMNTSWSLLDDETLDDINYLQDS